MSPRLERAVTLLRAELRDGSVPAVVLLQKALALGLNRDSLKVAKKSLSIVALCDRDPQTGRTLRWRWSLPMHAPVSRSSLIPHRWGLYSYHTAGRYYYKQGEGDTFKNLIAGISLDPPLWVLLVTDAARDVLTFGDLAKDFLRSRRNGLSEAVMWSRSLSEAAINPLVADVRVVEGGRVENESGDAHRVIPKHLFA